MTRMAIIYPLMVATLAYFGLVLFFLQTLPTLLAIYDDSRTEPIRVIEALRVIEGWNVVWMPAVPVILLVLVAAWWWRGQRASSLDRFEPSNKLATRNFSARTMRYAGEVATFSDLMRLLIEHHMTTHEAISLAARCCANARFVADADTLAEQIRMGQAASVDLRQRSTIPSLLRWALINAVGRETLVESLRVASRSYHELATEIHANLRLVVPTALMLLIGSSTLLAYSLVSFLPWFLFMKELAAS
jgi:type II secretory pathway component PulF